MRDRLHLTWWDPRRKEMHFASHHVWQDQSCCECIHRASRVRKQAESFDTEIIAHGQNIIRPVERTASVIGRITVTVADAWSFDSYESQSKSRRQLIVERSDESCKTHTDTNKHCRALWIPDFRKADSAAANNVTDLLVETLRTQKAENRIFDAITTFRLQPFLSRFCQTWIAHRLAP